MIKASIILVMLCFFAFPLLAYDFSSVDQLIADSLTLFDDTVIVWVEKDGQQIHYNSVGDIDSTTKLGLASASKWLSSAIILRCAELGYFALDDSLGKYLPLFSENGTGHITIRQCFSMSSGLYGGERYENNGFLTLARSVDSIAVNVPLSYDPGTLWAYDGKGMQSAGRAAEVASGKTWRQLAQETLFGPCGMDSSSYDELGMLNPGIPGGARSTPADYMRFLRMVINGGMHNGSRVLAQQSIDVMYSGPNFHVPLYPQASPVWPVSHPDYPHAMDTVAYGFGSWVLSRDPGTGHVEEISSPGLYGTAPWADRCRNLIGIVFMHRGIYGPLAYYTEIMLISLVRDEVGGGCAAGIFFRPCERLVQTHDLFNSSYAFMLSGRQISTFSKTRASANAKGIYMVRKDAPRIFRHNILR